jgi:hypothetical protein
MIKHVVCFKLKDNSPEHCKKIKELMLTMKDNIEYVRDVEVGIDFLHSPRSYDIMLSVYRRAGLPGQICEPSVSCGKSKILYGHGETTALRLITSSIKTKTPLSGFFCF